MHEGLGLDKQPRHDAGCCLRCGKLGLLFQGRAGGPKVYCGPCSLAEIRPTHSKFEVKEIYRDVP